jgi:NitT/TauT family transport system ATP-binding protein
VVNAVTAPGMPSRPEAAGAPGAPGAPGRREAAGGKPGVSLEFAGVSKRFDDGTLALLPVSFSARPAEFVAIVGPSGCGKSTLLRLAAHLTFPSTGTLTVGGNNVGYVFQDPTLLPWRSVRRNVELLGELHGVPKPERQATARAAIETVGLTGFEDKYPRALSGGMRMRASLARALTMSPDVFLFDEPFGAVDEITRERLNDELLGLFQARRFTALFVTHSVTEAAFLATRVLVMSERPGRILADLAVPFPYPRRPELRYDPAFAQVTGTIGAALRAGPGGGSR